MSPAHLEQILSGSEIGQIEVLHVVERAVAEHVAAGEIGPDGSPEQGGRRALAIDGPQFEIEIGERPRRVVLGHVSIPRGNDRNERLVRFDLKAQPATLPGTDVDL